MASHIDMTQALGVLDDLRELLEQLDGEAADNPAGESNGREERRRAAGVSRDLLRAQHLARKIEVAVGDQFYVFRQVG